MKNKLGSGYNIIASDVLEKNERALPAEREPAKEKFLVSFLAKNFMSGVTSLLFY